MAYEVFKRPTTRADTPTVWISVGGKIALNAAAARILTGAGIKSVLLLWDKTNRRIAIKAAQKSDENTFAASIVRSGTSGTIRAKAFVNHIGWAPRKRERLPATWNEKEKMFEIALPLKHLAEYQLDPLPEDDLTTAEERDIDLYLRSTSLGTVPLTIEELFKAFAVEHSVRSPQKARKFMEQFFERNSHSVKKMRRSSGETAFIWKRGS